MSKRIGFSKSSYLVEKKFEYSIGCSLTGQVWGKPEDDEIGEFDKMRRALGHAEKINIAIVTTPPSLYERNKYFSHLYTDMIEDDPSRPAR